MVETRGHENAKKKRASKDARLTQTTKHVAAHSTDVHSDLRKQADCLFDPRTKQPQR
jgi:hypothetical protein